MTLTALEIIVIIIFAIIVVIVWAYGVIQNKNWTLIIAKS